MCEGQDNTVSHFQLNIRIMFKFVLLHVSAHHKKEALPGSRIQREYPAVYSGLSVRSQSVAVVWSSAVEHSKELGFSLNCLQPSGFGHEPQNWSHQLDVTSNSTNRLLVPRFEPSGVTFAHYSSAVCGLNDLLHDAIKCTVSTLRVPRHGRCLRLPAVR